MHLLKLASPRQLIMIIALLLTAWNSSTAENLNLSGDERWVSIASRQDLVEAISIATQYIEHGARVVRSDNGWYAVVLGPHTVKAISDFRVSYDGPELPSDAYLAKGSNYVETVWTEAERWVVIASRQDMNEAIEIAKKYSEHASRIVESQNGWFAVVIGPYRASDISSFRKDFSGPSLPGDSILARGSNYSRTVWNSASQSAYKVKSSNNGAGGRSCSAIVNGKCTP